MKLYDGGIIFFIVVGVVATVIGGHVWDEKKKEQEYRYLSHCLDNAVGVEERTLCGKLFSLKGL